jgi:hypothetical protein
MATIQRLYSLKQLTKKRKAGEQVRQDQFRKGYGTDSILIRLSGKEVLIKIQSTAPSLHK